MLIWSGAITDRHSGQDSFSCIGFWECITESKKKFNLRQRMANLAGLEVVHTIQLPENTGGLDKSLY